MCDDLSKKMCDGSMHINQLQPVYTGSIDFPSRATEKVCIAACWFPQGEEADMDGHRACVVCIAQHMDAC